MSLVRTLIGALVFGLGLSAVAYADDHTITIAYQTGFSPFVRAVASGEIEKIPGWKVEFRQFNSGAEIFAAVAAGDVQIGDVGSSPFAASVSKGIDVKAVYISGAAGEDEALVARNGSGINNLADLKGKRVAAAPVSTDHFMLLSTLKQEGIKADEATVLAIPQPEIVAGWQRGDIDAAFVWDPALGKLLESGKVLLTAKQAADRGAVTFGALVATGDLVKEHADFVQQFVKIVDKYYRDLETHPENWTATSENVKALSKFTGAKPEDIADRLKVSVYVPAADQASPQWLGGGESSKLAG
ncbi:MAG TPA: ABC transporter substrate-binding protein, partial [Candidatus Binatia bacterium]|nr:ABC transporter substrate-binding protein [Candidatus Binatia bacterium]